MRNQAPEGDRSKVEPTILRCLSNQKERFHAKRPARLVRRTFAFHVGQYACGALLVEVLSDGYVRNVGMDLLPLQFGAIQSVVEFDQPLAAGGK